MKRLSIIIPTRLKKFQDAGSTMHGSTLFLEKALNSIVQQKLEVNIDIQIIICVDKHVEVPSIFNNLIIAESNSNTQPAALNAGLKCADGEYVAILEDDDEWYPFFIDIALKAIENFDFVSSNQLEILIDGNIRGIFDFPTPSGWFMKREVYEKVGIFNESFRWHIDNEWLGRLSQTEMRRVHLIEATAPIDYNVIKLRRPELADLIINGGKNIHLFRHRQSLPLIKRLVQSTSGMAKISTGIDLNKESRNEYERLITTFGRVPW